MDVITVGGAETEDSTPPEGGGPARSAMLFAAGGLIVGLTFGVVFAGGDTEPATTTTTLPETVIGPSASPTTTTTTVPTRFERLATMAPGLTDTLVTVSVESTGIDGVTVWTPSGRNPVSSSLPIGSMSSDALHQWLATITTPRYSDRGALWVGNAAYMEPLAVDVLGMAWHSRLPGELVWTEQTEDEIRLMRAGLVPGRSAIPFIVTVLDEPAIPVWWTDTGVVVLRNNGRELSFIGPNAATLEITEFVTGSTPVAVVIGADDVPVLIAPDLTVIGPAPWDSSCRSGAFSSFFAGGIDERSSRLAVHCVRPEGSTFELWRVAESGGFEQVVAVPAPNGTDPGWTSDGGLAYVVNPNPLRPSTELIFLRTDGTALTVTHPGRVIEMESLQFNVER